MYSYIFNINIPLFYNPIQFKRNFLQEEAVLKLKGRDHYIHDVQQFNQTSLCKLHRRVSVLNTTYERHKNKVKVVTEYQRR